jgi:Kdo2-lipid IVA lauroyltransferase/acyltransferase
MCIQLNVVNIDGQSSNVSKSVKGLQIPDRLMKERFPLMKFLYWILYRAAEYSLRAIIFLVPRIPRRVLVLMTSATVHLTFAILWPYRKLMEENASMALNDGPLPVERRKLVARMAWRNFVQGLYETACTLSMSRDMICASVPIEGEKYLQQALKKGKGVIALGAHLGNFTMIGPRVAAAGYPFSILVKHPSDQRLARLLDSYRAKRGMKTISAKPRRQAARQILIALRRNEVVCILPDVFKTGKVNTQFLGSTVYVRRGPVTLALRAGAAVLPMCVTRDAEDRLTLRISPEIDLVKTGDPQEDVTANLALFSRHLEDMIRRYPDQWCRLSPQGTGEQNVRPIFPDFAQPKLELKEVKERRL